MPRSRETGPVDSRLRGGENQNHMQMHIAHSQPKSYSFATVSRPHPRTLDQPGPGQAVPNVCLERPAPVSVPLTQFAAHLWDATGIQRKSVRGADYN
jgi:hypothetical protein